FVKPVKTNQLRERLRRLVEHLRLKRQHHQLKEELSDTSKAVEILQAQATRDPLTGLFNHAYFQDQLINEISRCKRYEHELGLLFIDVDNFKEINDSIGHQGGDLVLKTIANILKGTSRDVDVRFRLRDHDFAARYGGDEFVLMLPETDKTGSSIIAERLRSEVETFRLDTSVPIKVTLSIGVAAFPRDGGERNGLIAAADIALYAAKRSGRNRVISYSDDFAGADPLGPWNNKKDVLHLDALERTLSERSLHFAYQPIIDSKTNQVFGYEALCRPDANEFQNPLDLITAAERSGKICELGRILRDIAVAKIKEMPPGCSLFINLHPQELNDASLVEEDSVLAPMADKVVFEINNSRKIADQSRLHKVLTRLRERGYRILLDDLCTGYMGLNSLSRLEPDFVKMDSSILHASKSDGRASRLIKHYLDYTAGENITVIASGIETEQQRQIAVDLGCPLLQGYYFAKAGPEFVESS
ncbi:MAG: GGDEF and EAL domain-containing protein, partial [Deltaproteobacteria bacterium]|nr:GGDEF and EAL domain-containing protein [Deltaproteobacteria bacterium]